ncbi:UV-stimulated scaffold protein A isoform X2 [Erpetoichthys calabaricus]|nr:UV-stimulated scaffold protein A isoform X2 [Erpetoichthys calabaricus]XP_028657427.2 UV-stimulated scaffold protein A isoform X2 [Erpetoichthys calabaricus]
MDNQKRETLSALVEELTTSGQPQLDSAKMKQLKQICKSSNEYIDHIYHLIMTQLNEDHAEIRLSAFQIADELFARSHHFRSLLVSNFQEFLELTVETDPAEQPLPPPKEAAQKLKIMAIKSVQEWQSKYGEAYKKLAVGYNFLRHVKKVDFNDVEARTLAERKKAEEKQKRLENIYKDKVCKVEKEMGEMASEIQECLTEIDNCFKLLLSDPADFTFDDFIPSSYKQNHFEKSTSTQLISNNQLVTPDIDDEVPCCSKDLLPMSMLSEDRKVSESTVKHMANQQTKDSSDDESDIEQNSGHDNETFLRNNGIISYKYSLDLDISSGLNINENENNEAVVATIRDLHRLITTKLLPSVQSWIQIFTKAGINDDRMKRAIDFKKALEIAIKKHEDLHINYKWRERKVLKASHDDDDEEDDDDDDDDFEEVPEKEGFEPTIPDHLREEYGLEPSQKEVMQTAAPDPPPRPKRRDDNEEMDPTCAAATLKIFRHKLQSSLSSSMSKASESILSSPKASIESEKQDQESAAPVIPFGLDLYYWGEDQPTAGRILKFSSQHQFWVPHEVEEEVENKELAAMMKTRYITFAGKFEPVKHKCKAPMPNGSLCERQDRIKCPFHGLIVPRDDLGNPTNPEDIVRLEKEKKEKQEVQPDWRDPEMMREIEAATGVDLGSAKNFGKGKGSGKAKKRKYPNLTDLKKRSNTTRSRLEKRVFNKAAVKRVTEAMNRIDSRKHEKFSNQFNYALH